MFVRSRGACALSSDLRSRDCDWALSDERDWSFAVPDVDEVPVVALPASDLSLSGLLESDRVESDDLLDLLLSLGERCVLPALPAVDLSLEPPCVCLAGRCRLILARALRLRDDDCACHQSGRQQKCFRLHA